MQVTLLTSVGVRVLRKDGPPSRFRDRAPVAKWYPHDVHVYRTSSTGSIDMHKSISDLVAAVWAWNSLPARESELLHQSSHFGGNFKLSLFHSNFLLSNTSQ